MNIKNKRAIGIIFLLGILFTLSFVSAVYMSGSYQYTAPGAGSLSANYLYQQGISVSPHSYWDPEQCQAGQDFIIQIAPTGCEPAVVRSDILEEQNVPVFCPLMATKVNPLIEVEAIDYMHFTNIERNEYVSGMGFHPANIALKSNYREVLNSPIMENIGYAVIVLKQNSNESSMPEFVNGSVTAKIRYDIENTLGVGGATFYLPEISEADWDDKYKQYGFWQGRGFLKADVVDNDKATITVYRDAYNRVNTMSLAKGQTSGQIYLPGFYCLAGFKLRLDGLTNPDTRARLNVNNQIIEVGEKEEFLEGRCTVNKVEKEGLNQRVSIRCATDSGGETVDLKISPRVILKVKGEEKEYGIGDWLFDKDDKSIYLGAIGTEKDSENLEDLYIYLLAAPGSTEKLTEDDLYEFGKLVKKSEYQEITDVLPADLILNTARYALGKGMRLYDWVVEGENVDKISYDSYEKGFRGETVSIVGFAGAVDLELDEDSQKHYDSAMQDYENVFEDFVGEPYSENRDVSVSEEALYSAYELAKETEQKKVMLELCDKFKTEYPDSTRKLEGCEDEYRISSDEISSKSITINGQIKTISFESVTEPSFENYGIELTIKHTNGDYNNYKLTKNEIIYLDNEGEFIRLKDLEEDEAKLEIYLESQGVWDDLNKKLFESGTKTLEKGVSYTFDSNYLFTLNKINLKKSAKVSVVLGEERVGTEANFSYNIGIEKRAIQLSPEKIDEKVEKIDKRLKEWNKISGFLGDTVKGFKAACYATGTYLTAKNWWTNLDGKSIARKEVMRSTGGWTDICEKKLQEGDYEDKDYKNSMDSCFLYYNEEIEKDVQKVYEIMNSQKEFPGESNKETLDSRLKQIGNSIGEEIQNPNNPEEKIKVIKDPTNENSKVINVGEGSNVLAAFSNSGKEEGRLLLSQARDIERLQEIIDDPSMSQEMKNMAKIKLYSLASDVEETSRNYFSVSSLLGDAKSKGYENADIKWLYNENAKQDSYNGWQVYGREVICSDCDFFKDDELYNVVIRGYEEYQYLFVLNSVDGSLYSVGRAFNFLGYNENNNIKLSLIAGESIKKGHEETSLISKFSFVKYDEKAYKNKFENAQVRYYETGAQKGYPALVPVDVNNGWYVKIKATDYRSSAEPEKYTICNVMGDGRIGDNDVCQEYIAGVTPSDFSGLDNFKTKNLIRDVEDAIRIAGQAYGKNSIFGNNINLNDVKIPVGQPMADIPDEQCQDFMSPADCNLMFNTCDPVVCPSSRCDFGGQYPVDNVIQSGIVGSLAMCYANYPDVKVPVCLSGLNAGVESLISVEESYKDCLEHSKETGETIGICDEVYSIYKCEFFWRQVQPLATLGFSSFISVIKGQTGKGGGEYLGIQSAFKNAEDSVSYMTKYYGENAYKGFKARSTKDIGTTVCKLYSSITYPDSGSFFDALLEPDSPSQFSAWFHEIPFTDATVPPISQYKVFYHIFAGKDQGAYYSVYLSAPTGSSFYTSNPTLTIATGFIEEGQYATETKDLTAPAGYNELCINVNGQTECGFKQVSTSFAVNYIEDLYLKEQASQTDITTSDECTGGTSSLYSFVTPNVQEGADEYLNPSLADRGIVRVCSTNMPGVNTGFNEEDDSTRWELVGYCNEDKTMGCWLDRESVKEVIEFQGLEDDALEATAGNTLDALRESEAYISDFEGLLKEINNEDKKSLDKIKIINENYEKVIYSYQKANLLYLRGLAYGELAKDAFKIYKAELERKKLEEAGYYPVFIFDPSGISLKLTYYENSWMWKKADSTWTNVDSLLDKNGVKLSVGNEQAVATVLKDKNYRGGLEILIKMINNLDSKIITERTEYNSEGKFIISWPIVSIRPTYGIKDENRLYLVYNEEWRWSEQDSNYKKIVSIDPELSSQVKETLEILEGKEFLEGALKIFEIDATKENFEDEFEEDLSKASENSLDAYREYKSLFEKYSAENVPEDWSEFDFRTLLIAIAHQETELGAKGNVCGEDSKDPCSYWLMGYEEDRSTGKRWGANLRGPEQQIKQASEELELAFEYQIEEYYKECKNKEGQDKVECILSVYKSGENPGWKWPSFNDGLEGLSPYNFGDGGDYAEEVMILWDRWKKTLGESSNCADYLSLVSKYASKFNIDPYLVLAVMLQESGCDYSVVSPYNSYGLMQIEEKTFEDICKGNLESTNAGFDRIGNNKDYAESNIECGIMILKSKYNEYKNGVYSSWSYENVVSFRELVDACVLEQSKYASYEGWQAALRGYNGWGCAAGADVDYVEKVWKKYQDFTGDVSQGEIPIEDCIDTDYSGCIIWEVAKQMVEEGHNTVRESEKDYVCARFVTEVLINSGIRGFGINDDGTCPTDSVDKLLETLASNVYFDEISDLENLRRGDLVAWQWESGQKHMTIFDRYSSSNSEHLYFYGEGGEFEPAERQSYTIGKEGEIIKVYRFKGSSSGTKLYLALIELERLIDEYGKNAKYSDRTEITFFVDEDLCNDNQPLLEVDECDDIDGGWFGWGESSLEEIKILIEGKIGLRGAGGGEGVQEYST